MTVFSFVFCSLFLCRLESFCIGAGSDVWKVVVRMRVHVRVCEKEEKKNQWLRYLGVIMMFVGGSCGLAKWPAAVCVGRQV